MNIYLITSESYNLINEELNKIIPDSLNAIKYDLRKDNINDVVNEANYFSFDPTKKYIVVRADEIFKAKKNNVKLTDEEIASMDEELIEEINSNKQDLTLLEKYLDDPSENSVIVFISMSGVDKRKKIYKQVASVGKVIDIPVLKKYELVNKCVDILKKEGYYTNYDTANVIVENSFSNYDVMLNEIEKIKYLVKKGNIYEKDLKDVISESLNSNVFKFINSVINQNIEEAFINEKDFIKLKIDPIMVFTMLSKEYQYMYLVKTHNNANEVRNLLKQEDWKINSYYQNASKYTVEELKNIIIKLSDYDVKLKNGELNKDYALSIITLDICS